MGSGDDFCSGGDVSGDEDASAAGEDDCSAGGGVAEDEAEDEAEDDAEDEAEDDYFGEKDKVEQERQQS